MPSQNVYNELYGLIYRLTLRTQELEKEVIALKNFRSCYDPTFSPFNSVPKEKKWQIKRLESYFSY